MPHVLIALLLAMAGLASAAEAPTGSFTYATTLDANGTIVALAPVTEGTTDALQQAVDGALREQLKARSYHLDAALEPPVQTWLSGEFVLREDGADYVLALTGLRAGPRLLRMKPPLYPVPLIRGRSGADVLLDLEATVEGAVRVADSRVTARERLSRNERNALERAIEDSVAGWQFEPERDASGLLPGRPAVAMQLRITETPMEPGVFEPLQGATQRGWVQVPSADFTPLLIQVTGSRVRRGVR